MGFFVQLCSIWQDFNWRSASRSSSAIAELSVHEQPMGALLRIGCCSRRRETPLGWSVIDERVTVVGAQEPTRPSVAVKKGSLRQLSRARKYDRITTWRAFVRPSCHLSHVWYHYRIVPIRPPIIVVACANCEFLAVFRRLQWRFGLCYGCMSVASVYHG